MSKNTITLALVFLAILVVGGLMTACRDLPPSTAQSEGELIEYMLDYISRLENQYNNAYVPPTNSPGYVNRAQTSLVVLFPVKEHLDDLHNPLELDQPIQAWWIYENSIVEASDPAEAIELYRNHYMTSPGIDQWGYYKLGIFSIAEDGEEAEVYLEVDCGLKCGHGNLYNFAREQYLPWNLIGSEWMWIE